MIDRQQIIVDDHTLRRLTPFQAVQPLPMATRPVASAVMQPAAKQQFPQAVAIPLQIFTRIIMCVTQIADRFLFTRRTEPAEWAVNNL